MGPGVAQPGNGWEIEKSIKFCVSFIGNFLLGSRLAPRFCLGWRVYTYFEKPKVQILKKAHERPHFDVLFLGGPYVARREELLSRLLMASAAVGAGRTTSRYVVHCNFLNTQWARVILISHSWKI